MQATVSKCAMVAALLLGVGPTRPADAVDIVARVKVPCCRRCNRPLRSVNTPPSTRYCPGPTTCYPPGPAVQPAPPTAAPAAAPVSGGMVPPLTPGEPSPVGPAGPGPAPAPAPAPEPTPGPAFEPDAGPSTAPPPMTDFTPTPAFAAGQGGGLGGESGALNPHMIGDQGPSIRLQQVVGGLPTPPGNPPGAPVPPTTLPNGRPAPANGARLGAVAVPYIRGLKISENQSPAPIDRVYTSFNYYDNVNGRINQRTGDIIRDLRVYRQIYGFEKTFFDQRASIGVRLPILSATSNSFTPGFGGTSTAFGDLALILKYALYRDLTRGNIFSTGLVVSAPTGSNAFGGAGYIRNFHYTGLQPYVGFLWNFGKFYLQGFSAIEVPTSQRDVTIFYNDLGIGYNLYRNNSPGQFLTGIVPTFEVHVNTPLNHRGFRLGDPAGTPDVVDLTLGSNFIFNRRSYLTVAVVDPVTGPKPFSLEGLIQFSFRF